MYYVLESVWKEQAIHTDYCTILLWYCANWESTSNNPQNIYLSLRYSPYYIEWLVVYSNCKYTFRASSRWMFCWSCFFTYRIISYFSVHVSSFCPSWFVQYMFCIILSIHCFAWAAPSSLFSSSSSSWTPWPRWWGSRPCRSAGRPPPPTACCRCTPENGGRQRENVALIQDTSRWNSRCSGEHRRWWIRATPTGGSWQRPPPHPFQRGHRTELEWKGKEAFSSSVPTNFKEKLNYGLTRCL